jgi:urocanate hydratase
VMRHLDAGYPEAAATAAEHGLEPPMGGAGAG